MRSFSSPSYPEVASNIAFRNRFGVSRVPGVSRSIPNAPKISLTYASKRSQSAASMCRGETCSHSVVSSGSVTCLSGPANQPSPNVDDFSVPVVRHVRSLVAPWKVIDTARDRVSVPRPTYVWPRGFAARADAKGRADLRRHAPRGSPVPRARSPRARSVVRRPPPDPAGAWRAPLQLPLTKFASG